jgi:hypothetical protein
VIWVSGLLYPISRVLDCAYARLGGLDAVLPRATLAGDC